MRRYETIVIIDSDVGEEDRKPILDRFEEIITRTGGGLIQWDPWGTRKLAYEIKKKPRGHFIRMDYGGNGSVVDEIERFCRIEERILKYMTVLLAESVDVEQVKEELAKAAAKQTTETAGEKAPQAQEPAQAGSAPLPETPEAAAQPQTSVAAPAQTEESASVETTETIESKREEQE